MGDRQSGQDVRTQNVVACQAVGNIVKSSLGPVGLDKMLVDDIGDVTITNDGAKIVKMLGVGHPATKVLVELAKRQDREVGDGKTSVFIIIAELLKGANDLARNMIHPTSISLASGKACKYFDEKLAVKVEKLGKDSLINCAKTSMSSKLISSDSDFFANLVVAGGGAVEAALSVYLEYLDTILGSREQSTEFVAKLWAYHHSAQTKADKKHLSSMGLDLYKGIVRNNFEALIIKPATSDAKIIQLVSEAAITILRIDDIIKLVKDESQDRE